MGVKIIPPVTGITQRGLIAEYRFEETSGTILHDFDGEITHRWGSATFTEAGGTTAINFGDSFSGSEFTFAPDAFGNTWTNFTIEGWLYIQDWPNIAMGLLGMSDADTNQGILFAVTHSGGHLCPTLSLTRSMARRVRVGQEVSAFRWKTRIASGFIPPSAERREENRSSS